MCFGKRSHVIVGSPPALRGRVLGGLNGGSADGKKTKQKKEFNNCNSGPDPGLFLVLYSPDVPSRPIKSHTTTRARTRRTKTDPNKRAHPHPRARAPCLLIKARRCLSLLSDGFRRSRSGTGSRQITAFGSRSPRTDSDRLPSSCPAQAAIQPLNSFTVSGAKTRLPQPRYPPPPPPFNVAFACAIL